MNRSIFPIILLFFTFIFITPSCKKTLPSNTIEPLLTAGSSYEGEWKQIQQMEQKGLSKELLKRLDMMLERAQAENNHIQVFKIFSYQSKYLLKTTEDAVPAIFEKYENQVKSAPFPLKQIMHSALGEMYLWYYQQNRWRYSGRTASEEFSENDILTWNLEQILKKTIEHYDSSLTIAQKLQLIDVSYAEDILIDEKSAFEEYEKELRPSLFDFLAHRALQFYKSGEAEALSPKPDFQITEKTYLKLDLPKKSNKNLQSEGFSNKQKALQLYQQLLNFHERESHINAVIFLKVDRLEYLKDNFQLAKQDSLYLSALSNILKSTKKTSALSEVSQSIAQFYFQQSMNMTSNAEKYIARKAAYDIAIKNIKDYPTSFGAKQSQALIAQMEQVGS